MIFPPPLPSVKTHHHQRSRSWQSRTQNRRRRRQNERFIDSMKGVYIYHKDNSDEAHWKKVQFSSRFSDPANFFSIHFSQLLLVLLTAAKQSHAAVASLGGFSCAVRNVKSSLFVECEINFRDERREGSAIKSPVNVIIYVAAEKNTHISHTRYTICSEAYATRLILFHHVHKSLP